MRIRTLSAVIALTLATVPAVASAADSPHATAEEITLVTGDKVSLGPDGFVTAIKPGEDRTEITFRTHRKPDGHTLVIPSDAAAPLAANRLDQRLFDVTSLREFGYRDRTPLLVDGSPRLAADDWSSLKNSVDKVWLDGRREPALDRSVKQIGAPAAHRRGITGQGVKVAVVDGGVDERHPDLQGKEIAFRNFTLEDDHTHNEHGTHVAATIASGGTTYGGVAPGAQLIDAKVCDSRGCRDSAIINGLRWAVEQGARIVNLSLGSDDTEEIDPLEQEINDLTAKHGVLFVVAAGNDGEPGSVNSPGSAEAALTVGAVDRDDKLASFSSRGPKVGAHSNIKPEVTAPGVGIVAAKAGSSEHVAKDGTSMATPHVAGAAALLKQQHPDWTAGQLKAALASTAKPTAGLSVFDQGTGRIDVAKAIEQPVVADTATLDLGSHQWPHDRNVPVTKTITYTNSSAAVVTLDLAIDSAAAPGMFSLSTGKVTVPAKGTSSVDVTGDPRAGSSDGMLTGEVLATSGPHRVRTPVALEREPESNWLALIHIGADGGNPFAGTTLVTGLDVPYSKIVPATGFQALRLPRGTYLIDSEIKEFDGAGQLLTNKIVHPGMAVTEPVTTVRIDARETRPISLTTPDPNAINPSTKVMYRRVLNGAVTAGSFDSFGEGVRIKTKQLGSPLPGNEFSSLVTKDTIARREQLKTYRLAYQVVGYPTGLVRAPRLDELARIETTVHADRPRTFSLKAQTPLTTFGVRGLDWDWMLPEDLRVTEFVTAEDVRWQSTVRVDQEDSTAYFVSPYRTYEAGRTYTHVEGQPVYGPGLPHPSTRTGTDLLLNLPLLADGNHGYGRSTRDSERTALYRDGVLVGENSDVYRGLPAQASDYRVERSIERGTQFDLSTRVSAVWTFRSAAAAAPATLPMSVVRFEPKLDAHGAVPAGTLQRLGLLTQSQGDVGELRDLRVEYSFDDGASWRRAGISGASALIYHPADARFASLRAAATDSKGNAFELTIIRAYRVTAG
ncbi:S8 family peptidase [Lentzea nigeriaca]|uniref:S8 family peptidase n=1 Tax=Lentzea nigeriaca TaxID=1128665 RepID=UPI00195C3FAC|nr:S8 family serine peptidase [Lentzea nigeriaca]MBM7863333.1 subtilisin family serine protease [Lentzea nigeriaca]